MGRGNIRGNIQIVQIGPLIPDFRSFWTPAHDLNGSDTLGARS
jgi:hypothetical protein